MCACSLISRNNVLCTPCHPQHDPHQRGGARADEGLPVRLLPEAVPAALGARHARGVAHRRLQVPVQALPQEVRLLRSV